jgi:hypothetical protein
MDKSITISPEAQEIHGKFAAQAGAEHIAKVEAIQAVLDILKEYKPEAVLEFGGGYRDSQRSLSEVFWLFPYSL